MGGMLNIVDTVFSIKPSRLNFKRLNLANRLMFQYTKADGAKPYTQLPCLNIG